MRRYSSAREHAARGLRIELHRSRNDSSSGPLAGQQRAGRGGRRAARRYSGREQLRQRGCTTIRSSRRPKCSTPGNRSSRWPRRLMRRRAALRGERKSNTPSCQRFWIFARRSLPRAMCCPPSASCEASRMPSLNARAASAAGHGHDRRSGSFLSGRPDRRGPAAGRRRVSHSQLHATSH